MLTAPQQCSVGINVNGEFIANIDVGDTEVWGQVLTQCSLCQANIAQQIAKEKYLFAYNNQQVLGYSRPKKSVLQYLITFEQNGSLD